MCLRPPATHRSRAAVILLVRLSRGRFVDSGPAVARLVLLPPLDDDSPEARVAPASD